LWQDRDRDDRAQAHRDAACRIVAGEVLWQGRDLVPLGSDAMRRIRAKEIAIVFQEPMTSLNPVYTVGDQIAEVVRLHEGASAQDGDGARDRDAAPGAHSDAGGARPRLPASIFGACASG